jgi:hypothetical protein
MIRTSRKYVPARPEPETGPVRSVVMLVVFLVGAAIMLLAKLSPYILALLAVAWIMHQCRG